MSIPYPYENPWVLSLQEQRLLILVVPDYFSPKNCPVFPIKTSLLSLNGDLEYRTALNFSFFQKSSNTIGNWVKDIEESDCPFFYIETKGAIYSSIEDAILGIPKNYLVVV